MNKNLFRGFQEYDLWDISIDFQLKQREYAQAGYSLHSLEASFKFRLIKNKDDTTLQQQFFVEWNKGYNLSLPLDLRSESVWLNVPEIDITELEKEKAGEVS